MPGFDRLTRLLAAALPASAKPIAAPPTDGCPVAPYAPPPEILEEIDQGAQLTTETIVARMGLVPTIALQKRIAAALAERGYHPVWRPRPGGGGSIRVWTASQPDPVSSTMRRVHETADRDRGLAPLAPRPSLLGQLRRALRGLL